MGVMDRAIPPTIDDVLAPARSGLGRLDPAQAVHPVRDGAILIDTRRERQRRAGGEIPGGIVIERNHLEWRCDPSCPGRVPEAVGNEVAWIVCCDDGYSPSLAAASVRALGLRQATDLIGGFQTWRAAGTTGSCPQTTKQAAAAATPR